MHTSLANHLKHLDSEVKKTSFRMKAVLCECALLMTMTAPLVAQTHFCIGGDLDSLSTSQIAGCQSKMAAVRDVVKRQGAPANWHFVVVCDDAGWQDYSGAADQVSGLLRGVDYSTDPRLHWTFLRGSQLKTAQVQTTEMAVSQALHGLPRVTSKPRMMLNTRPAQQYNAAVTRPNQTTGMMQSLQ